jgi:hypothetical protein
MFSKAVALAAGYTRPIIVSKRLENQEVSCGMGTFVVVNDQGWILTAAHIVADAILSQQHRKEREDYQKKVDEINANSLYSTGKKKNEINRLTRNWNWITHHSLWWAVDGIQFENIFSDSATDLAIAKLIGPIDKLNVKNFPTFADPNKTLKQGTSLCRLGFPFYEVKALFDPATQQFSIPDLPQLATFPNDGIYTRGIQYVDKTTGSKTNFIETSSPGLRGQSGGPIFDVDGTIWALQSRTSHFPLGFSPTVKYKGKEVTEHQFLHVGWGVQIAHIREMLDKYKVKYDAI